jgi:hypothetical protein
MQKIPKFGERIGNYDPVREEDCYKKLKEFLSRNKPLKKTSECEETQGLHKIIEDCHGLHTQYGKKIESGHYISPEEAFYLSTKRIINSSPVSILLNTQILLQKVLIYSYFKRKGMNINNKTSLVETLNKNFGIPRKNAKNNLGSVPNVCIKSPDEVIDTSIQTVYINQCESFVLVQIDPWDSRCLNN